jgi:hypothetical protein
MRKNRLVFLRESGVPVLFPGIPVLRPGVPILCQGVPILSGYAH